MTDDVTTPDKSKLYRFHLDRVVGKGGTGAVYRGIDTANNTQVAVKLFYGSFFRNRLHLREFARNVSKFQKFVHPNVVHIHEFIQGKEGECLIMEYIDGPDLRWYLDNRPWNLQERVMIGAQICNGLQYIHDRGFTHHDLKPSNILFTRKGLVKLVDYSLCGSGILMKLLDTTLHEQVTPMYVAPELIRNEKATPQSDIYSLGITFYLLFGECVPFPVDNLNALYQCHLRLLPDPPQMKNKKCPPVISEIIMKMIAKNPADRFRDCDQLRIALTDAGKSRI